jgi:tRNA A37 threonylcarbamoyladenosine dehydratase
MSEAFSRTAGMLGEEAMERLAAARVAVFGIGGVGGYAVEALARSGVGNLDLIDDDRVALSNINRQIIATTDTVGQYKVDAAAARIAAIHPAAVVRTHRTFYLPDTAGQFDLSAYDYIIDAVDTVTAKLALAEGAAAAGVPLISAMGAGNKLDPTAFRVADIADTTVCPLARIMRKELAKRGIRHLKVVYSTEPPRSPIGQPADAPQPGSDTRPAQKRPKPTPGSIAFVPSVVGLILAGEVIKDLTGIR